MERLLLTAFEVGLLVISVLAIIRSFYLERSVRARSKALEESERKFATAFKAIPDAVIITRMADGSLIEVNDGFTKITGYARETVVNRTTTEIAWLTDDDRTKMVEAIRTNGMIRNYPAQVRTASQQIIDIVISCAPVVINDEKCLLSVVHDVTEELKAERALSESERRFETIFNSSQVGMVLSRLSDGRILEVNRSFERISGLAREQIVGQTTVNVGFFSLDERNQWIERLIREGSVRDFTIDRKRRDGSRVVVSCSLEIVELASEKYTFLSVHDITERKMAEEALVVSDRKFQTLFQLNPAALAFAHAQSGRFVEVNQAFEEVYGIPRGTAVGKTATELGLYPNPQIREQLLKQLLEKGRLRGVDMSRMRKDGTMLHISGNAELLEMDGEQYLISATLDVSALKEAEATLRKTNASLEARVERRTRELQQSNQELEAFCYSVSHDLRAPLRSIDGFSQALEEDYSALLDKQATDYLGRIRRSAKRMSELIDNLLDLSRVTRAEIHRCDVNLSRLANEIITTLKTEEPTRSVIVSIAENLHTDGDKNLLGLVIENLLSNAWKYTSRTADARIEFGCDIINGQNVFYVRDNGVGFDPQYIGKLFQPFQRLHFADEFPGHGVGLATVMRIIKRHGGDVWAEGELEKGATFRFTMEPDKGTKRIHDQ
jgi:PAS domain S-box-containing protein